MQMEQSYNHLPDPTDMMPVTWDRKLARIISDVISPPVLTILGALFFAMAIDTRPSWIWTGLYVFIVMGIPTLYIVWLVKRGMVTDFHLRVREQRLKPNLMIAGCAISGWLLLLVGSAPYPLTVLAGIGVIQTSLLLLITTKWKISGHSMGIASFAILVWSIYGSVAFPVLFTIPLVAWARLRLKRHTLLQTVAGALMGTAFMGFILYLIANHCGVFGQICG
ncbi:MAG: phosphatase PAP2 family protein [Anaerolineales bacterium]|nr:phosphatase PAP2 family protein [Anaerolineales bacterium]